MEPNNYYDGIRAYCKRLRISPSFADRVARLPGGQETARLFYTALGDEVEARNQAKVERLMSAAGFPARYELGQFDPSEVEFPASMPLERLMELSFCGEVPRENVVMFGNSGTGKTMLSIILGMGLCRKRIPVRFFRTGTLVNEIVRRRDAGTLGAFLDGLSKASVLILDEFGLFPYDRGGLQILFGFLSEVHERKSIILNTSLEFSKWGGLFYDQGLATASVGRLMHHSHLLVFSGSDHRLTESSAKD